MLGCAHCDQTSRFWKMGGSKIDKDSLLSMILARALKV